MHSLMNQKGMTVPEILAAVVVIMVALRRIGIRHSDLRLWHPGGEPADDGDFPCESAP